MTDDGGQRTEDRCQRAEDGSQMTGDRDQKYLGMVGWMGSLAEMEEMQVLFAVSPLRW